MNPADIPGDVWALLPLALAAGLDLYLTLFFLGIANWIGWDAVPPGALTGLQSVPVLVLAGIFYLLELAAERSAPVSLFWNAVHVVVRPVTVGLAALLLLHVQPLPIRIGGAAFAVTVSALAHAGRVGGGLILWLTRARPLTRTLTTVGEDVVVLALCVLILDTPAAGTLMAICVIGATLPQARAQFDGFLFGLRAAWGRTWGALRSRRWLDRADFPRWVEEAVTGDPDLPGGPLRGSPAAGFRLPGAGMFRRGWVVVTGSSPVFLHRRWGRVTVLPLDTLTALDVVEDRLHRRIDLVRPDGRSSQLHFPPDGPSPEGLRAEFGI